MTPDSTDSPQPPASRASLWFQRTYLVVFVVFCTVLGTQLVVLPWLRIWTDNNLIGGNAELQEFLSQNFVRGAVSGLGLLDIWIGIAEAVRYREHPPRGKSP